MLINDLGIELKRMYENAPSGEAVVHIHLFGIIYGQEIKNEEYNPREIIKISGIKESYITELSKGIKLSRFVQLKK